MGSALLTLVAAGVLAACTSSAKSPGPAGTTTPAGNPSGPATESAPPGDIPDNQAFVPYSHPSPGYTVKVPEGWAMTNAGNAVVFTDKYNNIRIASIAAATAPTMTSARASEVPAIQSSGTGFRLGNVTSVSRAAGTAVLITYQADSAPNPVTGKVVVEAVERYEFWRNGTEITVSLSSPVGSDNVDPWRKVTDSFAWTP
jgi:hypothetical protein